MEQLWFVYIYICMCVCLVDCLLPCVSAWRYVSKTCGSWRRRSRQRHHESSWCVPVPTHWRFVGELCRRLMHTCCSWWSTTCLLPLLSHLLQQCHRQHRHGRWPPQHPPLHRDRPLFVLQVGSFLYLRIFHMVVYEKFAIFDQCLARPSLAFVS